MYNFVKYTKGQEYLGGLHHVKNNDDVHFGAPNVLAMDLRILCLK